MKEIFIATLFLTLVSCSTVSRAPSSSKEKDDLIDLIQQDDLEIAKQSNAVWESEQLNKSTHTDDLNFQNSLQKNSEKNHSKLNELTTERAKTLAELSADLNQLPWNGAGPWYSTLSHVQGVTRNETFALRSADDYLVGKAETPSFALEHEESSGYTLSLENHSTLRTLQNEIVQPLLKARMDCDGDATLEIESIDGNKKSAARIHEFDWAQRRGLTNRFKFEFSSSVQRCELKFKLPESATWTHQVHFQSARTLVPGWNKISSGLEVCANPVTMSQAGPAGFFWKQDYNAVSCPRPLESFAPLRNPLMAFNEKIKSLTGSDLPPDVLKRKNPTAKLNFTHAPSFDVIWVSALSFTADLYGSVLTQALRYHADRGTQIRILIPRARVFKKDEALLFNLQRGRPNVKLQIYEFIHTNGKAGDFLDKFHRVNHVKIVLGFSEKYPENNFVITGGRNIGDSYLLKAKPDYSAYPWLINYVKKERSFIYYDDFEVKFTGQAVTRSILSQLISFWSRDSQAQWGRSTVINAHYKTKDDVSGFLDNVTKTQPLIRHILSVPYSDGHQLEKFYSEMLDSAQTEVLITTPYFTPSEPISEALHRAHLRGVTVKILTGMSLAGDDIPSIVEDANKKGVNRHVTEVNMYQWNAPGTIMHAKLLVIDGKLSFISSVNLNGRSFTHDTESGVLILSEEVGARMKSEILGFLKTATPMTEKMKIKWFNGLLLKVMNPFL